MNAVVIPLPTVSEVDSALEALDAAKHRRGIARQSSDAAQAEFERKAVTYSQYRQSADDALKAIETNEDVQRAERLVSDQQNAEARLTAAANMLRKATDERDGAAAALQSTKQAVQSCAQAIVIAETRELHSEYQTALAQFTSVRYRLMAAYASVAREALTPYEWLALEQPDLTYAQLELRSPEWDVAATWIQSFGKVRADNAVIENARQQIGAQREQWNARLAELTRDTDQ